MQIELTIRANSLNEIAHIFSANRTFGEPDVQTPKEIGIEPERTDKAAEPETKPARRSRAKAEPTAAAPTPAEEPSGGGAGAPPSDAEPVTFEDLRTKTTALLDGGTVKGPDVQKLLKEKFGVPAFGALKPEQYEACMEELNNLG